MKKYLLLLTLSFSLFGQTPKSFAALGDVLYNDVDKFQQLKEMAAMQEFRPAIDAYIAAAEKTEKMGFAIDAKTPSIDPKEYLKALRTLSADHDAIIVQSRTRFKEAIADEDGETINKMVVYGVIDPEDYQDDLVRYYEEFYEDQNLSTLEPMYKSYIAGLKKDGNESKLTIAEREAKENAEKIKRMREKEKAKKEALNKSVNEEQLREKKKVLSEQKKELGIE